MLERQKNLESKPLELAAGIASRIVGGRQELQVNREGGSELGRPPLVILAVEPATTKTPAKDLGSDKTGSAGSKITRRKNKRTGEKCDGK